MTLPSSEFQQRIRRIESGLDQVGSLLVPVEISDGIKKAITLCSIDQEMALGRARKVLDFIIADLYKRELGKLPGTQPLENLIQQLARAGKLPRTMVAYANSVRELGNVGIHASGEAITEDDVVSSLENLMRLVAWYCEQVRPTADEKSIAIISPREDIKPPVRTENDTGVTPMITPPPVEIVPPLPQPQPVEQAPQPAPEPDPAKHEAEAEPPVGPCEQELLADSYSEKARAEPLKTGGAVPHLDLAIREYEELLAKADEVWSADAMYRVSGLDKPLKLSKKHWIDNLQYKIGDAYVTRAMAKIYGPKYGAAAAKPDLDHAIPLLEEVEQAKITPDMTVLDANILLNVRSSLSQAYFFRANCPNPSTAQLHDIDEYVRRWEISFGETGLQELLQTVQFSWFCMMLERRATIKSELRDYAGAIADLERVISMLEAARQARPTDASIASELQSARELLAGTKSKAAVSKFTSWFKRK